MLFLDKEKIQLCEKQHFDSILKELQFLLNLFINNALKSYSTKTFLKTNGITKKEKFIPEAVILYIGKAIFVKYCVDNSFLPAFSHNNRLYESVNEFYEHFVDIQDLTEDSLYEYYIPPTELDSQLSELLDKYDFKGVNSDLIGKLYEQTITKEEKILLGQVYTPDEIIDYILHRVEYKQGADLTDKRIIDISCGSGAFLFRAANILVKNLKDKGFDCITIFETLRNNIWGLDINPFSLKLAELNLLIASFDILREIRRCNPSFKTKPFNLFLTSSVDKWNINDSKTILCLKNKLGDFKEGFHFVVGNPPYLEAKKMPEWLKTICRENFPGIAKGAFDLYFCFIKMALELLAENGTFGYIIPNKFQVLKSASLLRKHILDNYSIEEITDISNLNVFRNISVYPILLFIRNQKENDQKVKTFDSVDNIKKIMSGEYKSTEIEQNNFRKIENFIFYTLPQTEIGRRVYKKVTSCRNVLLRDYLDIRWTISFHKRDIISGFVSREPTGMHPKPILGADIYSRDSEVFQYRVKWNGYWIDYDEEKAKKINNPLPPREIFETPKLIIRQNADKLTTAIDKEGKWYLKDVFFSGRVTEKAKEEKIQLEFFAAILNSRLMNYYYSIVFKGGHVNGGYLHFLVSYLGTLPLVFPSLTEQQEIVDIVSNLTNKYDEAIKQMLDNKICKLYGLSSAESAFIQREPRWKN